MVDDFWGHILRLCEDPRTLWKCARSCPELLRGLTYGHVASVVVRTHSLQSIQYWRLVKITQKMRAGCVWLPPWKALTATMSARCAFCDEQRGDWGIRAWGIPCCCDCNSARAFSLRSECAASVFDERSVSCFGRFSTEAGVFVWLGILPDSLCGWWGPALTLEAILSGGASGAEARCRVATDAGAVATAALTAATNAEQGRLDAIDARRQEKRMRKGRRRAAILDVARKRVSDWTRDVSDVNELMQTPEIDNILRPLLSRPSTFTKRKLETMLASARTSLAKRGRIA